MKIIIYVMNIGSLDSEAAQWQNYLDPHRRAAAARYHFNADRARCVGAGLLLAWALRQFDPAHQLPPEVELSAGQKPYIPSLPEFHFNLAHSGNWSVCATGQTSLGVDIERTDRPPGNLARRFFTPAECTYLASHPESARQEAFFDIWTLKESYLKATGQGIRLPLKAFSIVPGPAPRLHHPQQTEPYTPVLCDFNVPGYRLAVTARGTGPLHAMVREIDPEELRMALEL